jgi:selenocysteine-specific elongation factor
MPQGLESRIRSVQVHGASVPFAEAGTRVAMNLVGLDTEEVERGNVAAPPGSYARVQALDARLEVLPSCPREVKNRTRVRVYLGTAEVLARLNLLDAETLEPGKDGLVQLRLETPTVAARGDRFVLRFYSPMETIGGGSVIDTATSRLRRFNASVLENLRVKEAGTPEELVAEAVERAGLKPSNPQELARTLGMADTEVRPYVDALKAEGVLVALEGEQVVHRHRVDAATHQLRSVLSEFHAANPMRAGMSREEVRSRLSRMMDAKGFALTLGRAEAERSVVVEGGRLRLSDHAPAYTAEQQGMVEALERGLLADPFNAPFYSDLCKAAGLDPKKASDVWEALIDNGVVVRIAADLFLHREAVAQAVTRVREFLRTDGQMTAGQLRDLLGTTRKYAVPLMEYLDAQRVTRRIGDVRELF